jgi:hypothetical protein
MFDRKWGNQWQAIIACFLVLIACENPAPDAESLEPMGAAGSAAMQRRTKAGAGAWDEDAIASDALQPVLADAAVRRMAPPMAAPCADPPESDGACEGKLAGAYGVEVKVDVAWSDEVNPTAPAFAPGRGQVTALLIAELSGLCPGETEGALVTRICDLRLPVLHADATDADVQLIVPQATWEKSRIPEFAAHVRSSRAEPGFEIVSPVIAMLGIELESENAAWPSHRDTALVTCGDGRSGAGCFPDQDEDGRPGITLRAAASGTPLPTDVGLPLAGIGASALFAGLRTKLGGSYPVGAECNGAIGDATAADLELRVLDCEMQDGAPCTPGAATIADRNLPVFHAQRATNRVLRLSDAGGAPSCADVREAFAGGD